MARLHQTLHRHPYCRHHGSVVGVINPEAKYKVVIEAHADEIFWFVHYITDNGFIYLKRNGEVIIKLHLLKEYIHTDKGL